MGARQKRKKGTWKSQKEGKHKNNFIELFEYARTAIGAWEGCQKGAQAKSAREERKFKGYRCIEKAPKGMQWAQEIRPKKSTWEKCQRERKINTFKGSCIRARRYIDTWKEWGVEELGHGKEDDKRDKEKSLCARTSISTRDLNKEGSSDISGRGNSSSSGSMYQRQWQY